MGATSRLRDVYEVGKPRAGVGVEAETAGVVAALNAPNGPNREGVGLVEHVFGDRHARN
jgi:hypothetical protein